MSETYEAAAELADPLRKIDAGIDQLVFAFSDLPSARVLLAAVLMSGSVMKTAPEHNPSHLCEKALKWADHLMAVGKLTQPAPQ